MANSITNVKSNCLNTNNTGNGTIQKILSLFTDDKSKTDMKTWAAVRDPSDSATAENYNYIMSGVDINSSSVKIGDQIPALYCDKNGNWSVGYATVNKAPDGSYKVITVDPNGKYPCNNSSGNIEFCTA